MKFKIQLFGFQPPIQTDYLTYYSLKIKELEFLKVTRDSKNIVLSIDTVKDSIFEIESALKKYAIANIEIAVNFADFEFFKYLRDKKNLKLFVSNLTFTYNSDIGLFINDVNYFLSKADYLTIYLFPDYNSIWNEDNFLFFDEVEKFFSLENIFIDIDKTFFKSKVFVKLKEKIKNPGFNFSELSSLEINEIIKSF